MLETRGGDVGDEGWRKGSMEGVMCPASSRRSRPRVEMIGIGRRFSTLS